ncbi:hypothetical protein OAQ99_05845 [Candidatus Kapabacteria bacterium]|nr:hypothetical protein [Candidatus Kapabacteria bacterium]
MKYILILLGVIIIVVAISIFRPVPIVKEEKAITMIAKVDTIYLGKAKSDIYIKTNKQFFYINRGTDLGLDAKELKAKLIGKTVTLKYPEYWTPLDWDNNVRHLSKLEHNGIIYFNELK